MDKVIMKVLKVDQPIGEFYIGAIDSRTLNQIATVEIREFKEGSPDDIAGIQRNLSESRVRKIADYVNFDYATFPTSVVIAIDERNVELKEIKNCEGIFELNIRDFPGTDEEEGIPIAESAFIIDGQHRLAGLESLSPEKSFELNVSIFIGIDLPDKAEIFSTVNLAQTKVNKSLVYDLFSYAQTPSPLKTAHEVTIALNRDKKGPFYRKIKRLGTATPGLDRTETLTQATVVNGMLRYFSKNPEKERNKGILGLSWREERNEDWRKEIFNPFYRKDNDVAIFELMTNYFSAVAKKWTTAWEDVERGLILNRTNGYNALMRFFSHAYLAKTNEPRVVTAQEFSEIFASMDIESSEFSVEHYKPGSSGASALYRRFLQAADLE